jgi:hypothetical protein
MTKLSHYSIDTSPHSGTRHIVAGHRRGEGDTTVRVDEDQYIYDWAPTRQKSSSSSTHPIYIRRDDDAVGLDFGNTKATIIHIDEEHSTRRHDDHCAQLNQRFSTDLLCRCN